MITKSKIEIYQRFSGDVDHWARSGTEEEKSLINDIDWSMIDEILHNIHISKNARASESFQVRLNEKLKESCYNEEVIEMLYDMA